MSTWGPEDVYRWWGLVECDGLFLIFDTSAHVHDGQPDVSAAEVLEHLRDCESCQDAGHSVTEDAEGVLTLTPY